jgi:cyclase
MNPFRIMPILLLIENDCVKGEKFKNHKYVGDPLNIVKIFNDKEVDEIIILDINARSRKVINWPLIEKIANECRMPFSYGGNINNIEDIRKLNRLGVEKIILTQSNLKDSNFIKNAVKIFGSSTISFLLNIEKNIFNDYKIKNKSFGFINKESVLNDTLHEISLLNVGEIIIQLVNSEGTRTGFDFAFLDKIKLNTNIPIVLTGGINSFDDCLRLSNNSRISGAGIGAHFIFYGNNKAVLIDYFTKEQILSLFKLRT